MGLREVREDLVVRDKDEFMLVAESLFGDTWKMEIIARHDFMDHMFRVYETEYQLYGAVVIEPFPLPLPYVEKLIEDLLLKFHNHLEERHAGQR